MCAAFRSALLREISRAATRGFGSGVSLSRVKLWCQDLQRLRAWEAAARLVLRGWGPFRMRPAAQDVKIGYFGKAARQKADVGAALPATTASTVPPGPSIAARAAPCRGRVELNTLTTNRAQSTAVRSILLAGAAAFAFALASSLISAAETPGADELQPSSSAAYPFEEEVPPIGDNNTLTEVQIRYCLAQIIRIEAMRPLLNRYRPEQVDYFNRAVADYNSRCGRYRYEGDAHEDAKTVVDANRSQIESDARDAYTKRFAAKKKPAVASKPATTPTPQAKVEPQVSAPAPAVAEAPALVGQPAGAAPPRGEAKGTEPSKPTPAPPPQVERQVVAPSPPATAPRPAEVSQAAAAPPTSEARGTEPSKTLPALPQPQVEQQAAAPSPPAAVSRSAQVSQAAAAVPAGREAKAAEPSPAAPVTQTQEAGQPPSRFTPAVKPRAPPSDLSAGATPPEGGTKPTEPSKPAPAATQPTAEQQPAAQARAPEAAQAAGAAPSGGEAKAAEPSAPPAAEAPQPEKEQQAAQPPSAGVQPAPLPAGQSPAAAPPTPPTLARAETKPDSNTEAVLARFTDAVQRTGSQVLDERYYPAAARDKGWEGASQIEVRFAAGGFIQSIRLADSSGHPPLDDTALDIARNIRFPDEPDELHSREFVVRFPIVFRLQKLQ